MHITNFNISIHHIENEVSEFPDEYSEDRLFISICKNIKCPECSMFNTNEYFSPLIFFQEDNCEMKFICTLCWEQKTGNKLSKNMKDRINESIFNLEINEKIRNMGYV